MASHRLNLPAILARVATDAEETDAWTAATNVLRRMPPEVLLEVAKQLLVNAYFRSNETLGGDRDLMTLPLRPEQRRKRRQSVRAAAPKKSQPTGWTLDATNLLADVDRAKQRIHDDMWSRINRAVEKFTEESRAEWTAELLAGTFTGADGATVTWAAATIDDHRSAENGAKHATSDALLRVVMHRKAIEELEASGADTLGQLVPTDVESTRQSA